MHRAVGDEGVRSFSPPGHHAAAGVSGHDVAARISRVLHKKKEIMEFAIGGWSRGGKMTLTGVVGKS
jgi:hypothetical protein